MKDVRTLECFECQFFRQEADYCWCTFWSDDDTAITYPDGYCSNSLPKEDPLSADLER